MINDTIKRWALGAVVFGLLTAVVVSTAPWSAASPTPPALGQRASRACASTGSETVRTDKSKYPHYRTVHITGTGYERGCDVTVRVVRPDGSVVVGDGSRRPGSDLARVTRSGRLSYDYRLAAIDGHYRVEVLGARGKPLARTAFMDAFGLQKLALGSTTGPENYAYTAGNTVFAQGSVDAANGNTPNRSYRFTFTDPAGTARATTACTPNGPNSVTVFASYTLQPSDPVSNASDWHVVLRQYTDKTCTTLEKTSTSVAFDVAKPTVYGNAALTTQQSFFRAGTAAYIRVAGLKPSQTLWSTTWSLPTGVTACANTAGSDRAAADSTGVLPSGATVYLQYAPGATGSAWNLQSNYDAGSTCPSFSSTNQGAWGVTLKADATHFVTLAPFTVDATAPTSSASSPQATSAGSFTVSYAASDNSGGSGVASVDLYAKAPGDAAYAKVATDTNPGATGSFSYTVQKGDGTYSFYTLATDKAGNAESAPASPDSTTIRDTTAPASSASPPQYSGSNAFTVPYSASDTGSGPGKVELYAKGPGDSAYSKVATDSSPGANGSFSYTAQKGDGTYSFYTVATDKAGNAEAAPAGADGATQLDTASPSSQASAPDTSGSTGFSISYTAADDSGGSGLGKVDLYARSPGDSAYTKVATDTSPGATGSFAFTAQDGDGTYSFYTVATDKAGNAESAPASPDATTLLDSTAPSSRAFSPRATRARSFTVAYSAASGGAGLAKVDLYAKAPGAGTYTKVATDSSPSTSGSFTFTAQADGTFSFYTVATGRNGNTEALPSQAESTTLVDTTAPTSQAQAPATSTSLRFSVPYSATDGDGSGLASVDLYVKGPADGSFTKVATDATPSGSGSFDYTSREGNGDYGFYTIAADQSGNIETKAGADSTTTVAVAPDTTAPSSSASAPQYAAAPGFTVSYTAADDAGGWGLATVDLYAKGPADGSFTKVATDSSPGATGSFAYTAAQGDGAYSFYTVATDLAGNAESVPASADATTLLDTAIPTSAATAPQYATANGFTVSYTASGGTSGLARVELYAKGPTDSAYSKVATDSTPGATGAFAYTASQGDGSYSFYTLATDNAGNVEPAPASADSTTRLDGTAPASQAAAPHLVGSPAITVSYAASDTSGGSGLAQVDLYARGPGDSGYSEVATDASPGANGSFSYTAQKGDGTYSFYTVATDKAGNVESAPGAPDTATLLDTIAPVSSAGSPQYTGAAGFTVTYTASDGGAGTAAVDLYAKGPGDSTYSKVATDSSPGATGSFAYTALEGDGTYRFYTAATDKAGNVEAAPASADSTTQLDTGTPTSQASSPLYTKSSSFAVDYDTADEPGGSGIARIDLYVLGPNDANYVKVASRTAPGASGSFPYTANEGEGTYSFYTIAFDNAGNQEPKPDDGDPTTPADSTTRFDRTAPTSLASSPAYANTPAFTVTYGASDLNSGLETVELYAKGPNDSAYSKVATDSAPSTSGSFDYSGNEGNGTYSFYTIATDNAGNVEPTPSGSETTTQVDPNAGKTDVVDELHYTYTGTGSVAFNWRGTATDIRYGTTTSYGSRATASAPTPLPFSSAGPFQQVNLTNLQPGTTYHYSIGGGIDHTFTTSPTGNFRFDVEADIGSTRDYPNVGPIQSQIAGDNPAFVITDGDLTYGNPFGQASVDQAFNDIMAWSTQSADMPSWGNHEWEAPNVDDMRNYKGRFLLPHPQTSPSAPAAGCCGQDWSWFDAGGVRFINYPEPYTTSTWSDWQQAADSIFAAAQNDPSIHFIVTFGHQPAYSTGFHPGVARLATVLNALGDTYSKYVLNLNGHSHDYERFQPIHGVTHITTGGGGGALETPWTSTDPNTAYRAFHLEHLRIDVSSTGMRIDAICGPPTSQDDITCVQGSVIDSVTIGANPPPPPPPPATLYVDQTSPTCSDVGSGTQSQPFCSIRPAATRVVAGQVVLVGNGTYREQLTPLSSGTPSKPIIFAAAPGTTPTITGVSDGIYLQNLSNMTVQGFTVTGTSGDAVVVKNGSNVTIRGNHISSAGQPAQGLIAKGFRGDGITDSVIANNTVDHNTDYGIYLFDGSTRNQIIDNHVFAQARGYQRAASGIRLYGSTGNTIAGNVSHDNEDSGIEFFNYAGGNIVRNNILYGNGDHGVDDNNAPCQTIVSNSVYNNFTAGINLEGDSPGGIVENNVSVDNGLTSTRTKSNIRVDSTSIIPGQCVDGTPVSAPTVDYNLVNLSSPGTMYAWGNNLYPTLLSFQQTIHQEPHGLQADPQWADPSHGDFHLGDTSVAIDSADSAVAGEAQSDADGNPRVDDPYVVNTGSGPDKFHDRGAFEKQPEPPPDQAPYATLTVSPDSGTAPFSVTADASGSTDTDANGIGTYTFDFGDGTPVVGPQAGATATHVYSVPGIHTVKVTVTDTAGLASSSTKSVLVHDAPPTAALSVTPASGPAPLQVTADASSSTDADSTPIASYRFDFGDGSAVVGPQAGATASHTYGVDGTYTVTVTVTDTANNASSATSQVTVGSLGGDAPPATALTVTPAAGTAPLQVSADASASTDMDFTPIASYTFDFGDGSAPVGPQPGATVGHTFAAAGTYTVKVTATDTAGLSSIATRQVTVSQPDLPPAAALTVTRSPALAGTPVSADASASTDNDDTPIADYKFNFGDGTAVVGPQAGATTSHTFSNAGTYTVTVTVRDTVGNVSTATRQVTVYANAVSNSGFESNTTGWNTSGGGTGITLTQVTTGGHTGNGAAKLANPNTTATTCLLNDSPNAVNKTASGQYTGSMWVRADTGGATLNLRFREYSTSGTLLNTSTTTVKLTTSWQVISVTTTILSPGSTLDFNAYVMGAAANSTCFYADDASIYNGSPLEVPPNASLTVSPTSGIAPLQVSADASASTDTDTTGIATYTFDFGDNTPVVGPQPGATTTHTYQAPGPHTVKLTVTDTAGNSSTTTTQVNVGDAPPNARLTVSPTSGTTPLQVTADASGSSDPDATGIANYTFDFGDGTAPVGPQASPTATHRYTSLGQHAVTVTVTDSASNASSATRQVLVTDAPPAASLSVSPSSGAAPLQVTADGSASSDTDATPISTYKFDFGDGTAAVGPQAGATASHSYSAAGTYTVTMTVADSGGNSSTATRQVTVSAPLDQPPQPVLTVNPSSGSAPLVVTADASSSTDTDSTPIATYNFDFGDGTTGTGPQAGATASHTYTAAGTYTVTMTATDTASKSSSATTQVTVTDTPDSPPAAAINVTPSSGTAPLLVTADASASTDMDLTPIASYSFDFGDGSAAIGPQAGATATHTYNTAGTYTVTVTATDTANNSSSATTQVTVTPRADLPPAAALTVSPSSGNAPLAVTADASSSTDTDATPIATYKFDFGDNTAAVGPQAGATATHTYQSAGTYTVTVTVTDTGGKSSTATQQVTASPPDLPPAPALTLSTASGPTPLGVTADASGSTDTDATPIASYRFDFGDGATDAIVGPQSSPTATHTYATAGTYTVRVTVRDTVGNAASTTKTVTVFANAVTNPGFETNLTGWNTSGGGTGITLTQAAGGHSGSFSAKLSNPNATNTTCLLNDSPNAVTKTSAGQYTGSLWVRADTAGATLNLRFREYSTSGTLLSTATNTIKLATTWQQVSVTLPITSPGSTLDFNAYVTSAAPNTGFYADDAAVYNG